MGDSGGFSAVRSSRSGRSAACTATPEMSRRKSAGSAATARRTRASKSGCVICGAGGNDLGSAAVAAARWRAAAASSPCALLDEPEVIERVRVIGVSASTLVERRARLVEPAELEQRHPALVDRRPEVRAARRARRRFAGAPRRPVRDRSAPAPRGGPAARPPRRRDAGRARLPRRAYSRPSAERSPDGGSWLTCRSAAASSVSGSSGASASASSKRVARLVQPVEPHERDRPGCGAPRPSAAPRGPPPPRRRASRCSHPCRRGAPPCRADRRPARRPRPAARGSSGAAAEGAARRDRCPSSGQSFAPLGSLVPCAVTGGGAQSAPCAGADAGRRQPPPSATAKPATPTSTIGRAAPSEFATCISWIIIPDRRRFARPGSGSDCVNFRPSGRRPRWRRRRRRRPEEPLARRPFPFRS